MVGVEKQKDAPAAQDCITTDELVQELKQVHIKSFLSYLNIESGILTSLMPEEYGAT